MADVLDRFSPATRDWFRGSFSAPTAAQQGAWEAVSEGRDALVVAPTGSGKTLAAFLWALDRLASEPVPEEPKRRCRVLYISPLKALAVDVERNLSAPLVGIGHSARRLGLPAPDVRVSVRSGDTPANERRAFAKAPGDILITTPESLFLLLTSSARESLAGIETVIIDEVHAVAGTKRGAHLALSLERLDALLDAPARRIGLSATVSPVEEVARFLSGGRPVDIVRPPSEKQWQLDVVVPVEDLGAIGDTTADLSGPAAGDPRRTSIWPHVEERIVDLIAEHRSTLVFCNSRRLAERLTTSLNDIWMDRLAAQGDSADQADDIAGGEAAYRAPAGPPAQMMGQAGASRGSPAVLARAHHGSVSKEQRAQIEEALKSGTLPAVVATSSLELGIDMGAVDLVVQVESPPSVASGLQRVGRAGHQVGAVSHGVVFPKFRGDLVQSAVVVERMRSGDIEQLRVPSGPLDVLSQQIVAMCALDEWTVDELEALVRRAAPFSTLRRSVLEAVLDMLAGRYPSDEFAELRPRIVWDRVSGTLSGRRGAQRLAVTSGGTIPDRGLYAVFLASGEGPGRRVGELDEEMVYESRVGDVFTLGTSSWRIEDITHDRVLVSPAPGQPGRLPFWTGDSFGRPAELGEAIGAFVREVAGASDDVARQRVSETGLDEWAADNLLAYLGEQREATGHVPSDRAVVVERFRDELGDWRVTIHSPYGAQVHAPWALAIAARMRESFGLDVQASHGDDGIVLRLPDYEVEEGTDLGARLLEAILLDADEVEALVTQEVGGSALFASRFRECAARALLLPRRNPGKRQPLWQQRQRSAQLLEVAAGHASFPIVLEAVRECLQDVFDVPALVALMRKVASRQVRVVEVETPTPSPFAKSLMFGYVAQFLYEGDSPLAERRAAALTLDPSLLADVLGRGEGLTLRDLLDPDAVTRTEQELQRLVPERQARDGEDVVDLLRALGPLGAEALRERVREDVRAEIDSWTWDLVSSRQVIEVGVGGEPRIAAVEDAGRLQDALGVALPVGVPEVFRAPVDDPLGDLVARYARTHGPFTDDDLAHWLHVGRAAAREVLRRLVASGRLVEGDLLPPSLQRAVPSAERGHARALEFCDPGVLRVIRRRSIAALRAEVEPVEPRALARFLPAWQGIGPDAPDRLRGTEGLLRAVEQLSGVVLPASALESLVLPARVRDYSPAMLDELMATGDVLWCGHGSLARDDAWVSLHLREIAPMTLPLPAPDASAPSALEGAILDVLGRGGGWFFPSLLEQVRAPAPEASMAEVAEALWSLVWAGRVTGDTFAPVRARLAGKGTHASARRSAPRRSRYAGRRGSLAGLRGGLGSGLGSDPSTASGVGAAPLGSGALGAAPGTADGLAGAGGGRVGGGDAGGRGGVGVPPTPGRWSVLPEPVSDPTVRAVAAAEGVLDRYGIVTRGSVVAEDIPGGFAQVYRVLAAAEDAGRVRRGYVVEGLGASQFATGEVIDRLRAFAPTGTGGRAGRGEPHEALVLAASDPANPYGAALPWPQRGSDRAPDDEGGEERSTDGTAGRGHQPARKAGAVAVLQAGELVLYVERGGRTLLSFTDDREALESAAHALARAVHSGALGKLSVEKADGGSMLGEAGPLTEALTAAGFVHTPRGLRLRPRPGGLGSRA